MLDDMPVPWCLSRRRHYLPEPQGGIVFHTHEYCVAIGGLPVRYRTFMPTSRVYVRVFHAMQFDISLLVAGGCLSNRSRVKS